MTTQSPWWQEQNLRTDVLVKTMRLFQAEDNVRKADASISPMDAAFQTHFSGLGSDHRVGGFARLDEAKRRVEVARVEYEAAAKELEQFLASKAARQAAEEGAYDEG